MDRGIIDFKEKRIERLPPRELSSHLMSLPVRQRMEIVLQREDAEAVVQAMPEQDFYFTVKEIGPDDSLPFLALARIEQLDHLFDIEWWMRDEVLPVEAVEWLERLGRASEEKFLAWLHEVDFELLVTLVKKWIRVSLIPDDMDPLEAREHLPRNTLDDQYYWEPRYPQYEDFFTRFFGLLFEVNQGFYRELMNDAIWSIDIEAEEEAYRFHRGRIEDQSIPDYYDALEIYRPLRPEEVVFRKEVTMAVEEESDAVRAPSFAIALVPEGDLFGRALTGILDPDLLYTIQIEMAALSNKVIVADQMKPDTREALHFAVDKAAAYVNLGLFIKTAGDLKFAVRLLGDVFLEHLFRVGQTQVGKLKARMSQVLRRSWLSRWPTGLRCLEEEWMEMAELLLGKTPRLLRYSSNLTQQPREDFFRTQQDIFRAKHAIDVIISLGPLFDALNPEPLRLEVRLWERGQIRGLNDVTIGVILWTAAARFLTAGRWELEPLSVGRWPEAFAMLSPEAIEGAVHKWIEKVLADPAHRSLAEAYLIPLFRAYSEEMTPFFESGGTPEPEMVRFFLFTAEERRHTTG